jgi:biotin carboxylase
VIASGANVPFADQEIFYGPIYEYADQHLSVIPDFVANCGMARVFAYLMSNGDLDLSDEAIFSDTSSTIRRAIEEIHKAGINTKQISARGLEIALHKLI